MSLIKTYLHKQMSFVSNFTDPNIMNETQLEKLKENYANLIIDGMDMDTLCQFAFDSIMHNMEQWDVEDMKEEIVDIYDTEVWEDLIESVENE